MYECGNFAYIVVACYTLLCKGLAFSLNLQKKVGGTKFATPTTDTPYPINRTNCVKISLFE